MRVSRTAAIALTAASAVVLTIGGLWAARAHLAGDAAHLTAPQCPLTTAQAALGLSLLEVAARNDPGLVALARRELPAGVDGLKLLGSGKTANRIGAALLARGLVHLDRRSVIGGLTLLEGNLMIGYVIDASKEAFGRVRPNHPGAGRWYAGGDSFPSSHTAHAFLSASVLAATCRDPEAARVFYGLASGVALQRLHEGVHYPTDVVAGAALGWWFGERLSESHGLVDPSGGRSAAAR